MISMYFKNSVPHRRRLYAKGWQDYFEKCIEENGINIVVRKE